MYSAMNLEDHNPVWTLYKLVQAPNPGKLGLKTNMCDVRKRRNLFYATQSQVEILINKTG